MPRKRKSKAVAADEAAHTAIGCDVQEIAEKEHKMAPKPFLNDKPPFEEGFKYARHHLGDIPTPSAVKTSQAMSLFLENHPDFKDLAQIEEWDKSDSSHKVDPKVHRMSNVTAYDGYEALTGN